MFESRNVIKQSRHVLHILLIVKNYYISTQPKTVSHVSTSNIIGSKDLVFNRALSNVQGNLKTISPDKLAISYSGWKFAIGKSFKLRCPIFSVTITSYVLSKWL